MLKVKNSKAFIIGIMLSYNDKKELKQASADYIINESSELVKILREH